jgi:hypothetical protein
MTATTTTRSRAKSWFWGGEEPEWIVVALVVVALLGGALLMASVRGRVTALDVEGMTLTYPAEWSAVGGGTAGSEGGLVRVGALGSRVCLSLSVLRELDPANPVSMDALVAQRGFSRAQRDTLYRTLGTAPVDVGGRRAVAVSYAYAVDPYATAYQATLPIVMEGTDYILTHAGKAYVLSLEAPAERHADYAATFRRIVASVRY